MFQSSPTSQGGRYCRSTADASTRAGFQSSPTSQGGRYAQKIEQLDDHRCFNPRPPRKVGATRSEPRKHSDIPSFQSSPTSQGGRYGCRHRGGARRSLVSILAHLARWALQTTMPSSFPTSKFQSSPTSQGGRYGGGKSLHDRGQVSILAHLARWALRVIRCADCRPASVSILAHLARWALHRRSKQRGMLG